MSAVAASLEEASFNSFNEESKLCAGRWTLGGELSLRLPVPGGEDLPELGVVPLGRFFFRTEGFSFVWAAAVIVVRTFGCRLSVVSGASFWSASSSFDPPEDLKTWKRDVDRDRDRGCS